MLAHSCYQRILSIVTRFCGHFLHPVGVLLLRSENRNGVSKGPHPVGVLLLRSENKSVATCVIVEGIRMSASSKKQAKTEDLHNYPFDADIFRRTFNRYVQRVQYYLHRFSPLDLLTFHRIRDCMVFRRGKS